MNPQTKKAHSDLQADLMRRQRELREASASLISLDGKGEVKSSQYHISLAKQKLNAIAERLRSTFTVIVNTNPPQKAHP